MNVYSPNLVVVQRPLPIVLFLVEISSEPPVWHDTPQFIYVVSSKRRHILPIKLLDIVKSMVPTVKSA
jgi:hypothetical protein